MAEASGKTSDASKVADASQDSSGVASAKQDPSGLSANAEFLFTAVFKSQRRVEEVRRFFPSLRQWAETKKAYRGRTFTHAEIEEVIGECERVASGGEPYIPCAWAPTAPRVVREEPPAAEAPETGSTAAAPKRPVECWWPRWVLNKKQGVEVLAPGAPGKPPGWVLATPVGIGYHGQKRKYLFVRTGKFEMDCRRSEVRMPGGGRTVEELAEELTARGDDPARHPDWTDGSEAADKDSTVPVDIFITPGVEPRDLDSASAAPNRPQEQGDAKLIEELEGDFERMSLLRRSRLVKTPSSDHPDPLAEPRAAASIRLPELTDNDTVALPSSAAQQRLSSLQLETVCFAARRFRTLLPDGRAAGYVLGDGTGCGKGRVISAMLYHLWNCGHRRSIWVSATSDLYHDACRDLQDLGADIPCIPMRRLPPSGPLDRKGSVAHKEIVRGLGVEGNGVIFLTYSLLVQTGQRRDVFAAPVRTEEARRLLLGELLDDRLRCIRGVAQFGDERGTVELRTGDRVVGVQSLRQLQAMTVPFTVSFERVLQQSKGSSAQGKAEDDGTELTAWNSRLGQLVAWLGGAEATGLICFDEVHKAKNLVPDRDDNASTKTGLFVDLLQQHCPKAPVLYVSATAATEVQHLGYMSRLGAWGPGTAFENFHDFMKTIQANGVAAMEMFAMNMKALGALSCRSLAYVGTEFVTQQCGLTKEQTEVYNAAAAFWQKILYKFRRFVDAKELHETYRKKFFKRMKKHAEEIGRRLWQFFWGAQQRFFKAMCNAAKVPAACAAAREAVERGEQVVMSIWATGEARSAARMARLKEETPGRVIVNSISEGGLVQVDVNDTVVLEQIARCLYANLRLKSDVSVGGRKVGKMSLLTEVHGRRISRPEDLLGASTPARITFRAPTTRRLSIDATVAATGEPVRFELCDDALGERVVVGKVVEGPDAFRRAEAERWHVKTINNRPVGKVKVQSIRGRLRKGQTLGFQDAVLPEHLSGPQMILEHFLNTSMLTADEKGKDVPWAVQAKEELLAEMRTLKLPANAMDEIVDNLGGLRKVAEMSGRSHRMKRRKDGSLAYVARCEELRCTHDGANLVEQVLFQKGAKKICLVTEVASAGISLHADRRQVRKEFHPPRRTMISVELPWGADKAIQCFGRVHRANQLVPPRFIMMCTPLGGEVRFTSAIARRMKLLGAVTKGDRMTSMGGGADRHMAEFDVNNVYGAQALERLYRDTKSTLSAAPELLALYEALAFIGAESDGLSTGRWPTWEVFSKEVAGVWRRLNLVEEFDAMLEQQSDQRASGRGMVKESDSLNRFFNRILMLEVDLQNALFDTFFAIYSELERIDRANGVYDDGVENLNQSQGRVIRQIAVDKREILYTDPVSGAQTQYVRLQLDRGISWEDAREVYDALPRGGGTVEGFYAFRRRPDSEPVYILVKELQQVGGAGNTGTTWISRRRQKQYAVWRADNGVRSGLEGGQHAYSAADFMHDERYERLGDTEADLESIEGGWTNLYNASASTRLDHEHILTGDVLAAWRLTAGSARGKDGPTLQIVRAITRPHGDPVVGMRVAEEDLPRLQYVLGCQHTSAREGAAEKKPTREVALSAAGALLRLLDEAPERSLPYASWIEAHKVLSAAGAAPRTVDGLRGTQLAVDLLAKKKLVTIGEGAMALNGFGPGEQPPEGELLEMRLFPEEFIADNDKGLVASDSDGQSDDDFQDNPGDIDAEDLFDAEGEAHTFTDVHVNGGLSDSGTEADGASHGSAVTSSRAARGGTGGSAPDSVKKRKRMTEMVTAVSTPTKAWKSKGMPTTGPVASTAPRGKDPQKATDAPKRDAAKKLRGRSKLANTTSVAESLFDIPAKPTVPEQGQPALSPRSRKRDHDEMMAEALFGDFCDEGEIDGDADKAASASKDQGPAPAAAAVPAAGAPEAAVSEEREAPMLWTYEVTGKKLGIRGSPDVEAGATVGHLAPGEFFNVVERRSGKDGRRYLKLADGRGWAYDRSAKDIDKVVVREIAARPPTVSGGGG